MDKKKVEIVVLVPVASERERKFAEEIIQDLQVYFSCSFHVVFVDDSEDFIFRDFGGTDYTTIWSGGRQALIDRENFPVGYNSIVRVTCRGLSYIVDNFEFDFVLSMDADAAIVNSGIDNWIYCMYETHQFDVLGVQDDEAHNYTHRIQEHEFTKIIGKSVEGKVTYVRAEDATSREPVLFYAVQILSSNGVKRLVELERSCAVLSSELLFSKSGVNVGEALFSTVCRLAGLHVLCFGGMSAGLSTGSGAALPPLWVAWNMTSTESLTLEEMRVKFWLLHRLHGLCGQGADANRAKLSELRDR